MTARITHKTVITNTLTNEVTVFRHTFSDPSGRAWPDEYARAVLQYVDVLSSPTIKVEIVTVSEE